MHDIFKRHRSRERYYGVQRADSFERPHICKQVEQKNLEVLHQSESNQFTTLWTTNGENAVPAKFRMDETVARIVSGNIFRQFASFVRHEILDLTKGHPRSSSHQEINTSADSGETSLLEDIAPFNHLAQESGSQHPLTEELARHSDRPLLTARYLEVILFQGGDGEGGSALTLTDTLI
jgi:hypothetical protein